MSDFNVFETDTMPSVASELLKKLGLNSLSEVWNLVVKLDGQTVETLDKPVVLRVREDGVVYDGYEDDGYFYEYPVLRCEDFVVLAENLPFHPNVTSDKLIPLFEDGYPCIGAKYYPKKLVRIMGCNLGLTFLSIINLMYGLTYTLIK